MRKIESKFFKYLNGRLAGVMAEKTMNRLVAILQINLPDELIKQLMDYLYFTPQQIAMRELNKRVQYCITKSIHSGKICDNTQAYLFNYKHTLIYICFCEKCGNYEFSSDMEECVSCKC